MRCWSIDAGQQKQMKFFKQICGIQVPALDDENFSMRVLVSENLYRFRAESGTENLGSMSKLCLIDIFAARSRLNVKREQN